MEKSDQKAKIMAEFERIKTNIREYVWNKNNGRICLKITEINEIWITHIMNIGGSSQDEENNEV